MPISIIIPYRNEDRLAWTVDRIHETCKIRHEIICVDDGSDRPVDRPALAKHIGHDDPIGNCFSRHKGIMAARYKTVLLLDAHMNFWDDDWAPRLDDWSRANPKDIGCSVSLHLRPDRMEMERAVGKYWAAHIRDMDIDSSRRRRVLPVIWNKCHDTNAEVGSILGGAYVMQRQWYIDGLLGIWLHLLGWGSSESTLSIANYLMGGRNVLLDVEIGHMYRAEHKQAVPYQTITANLIYNMLFLAHVVVWDDDELGQMIQHLSLKRDEKGRCAVKLLDLSPWKTYRLHYQVHGKKTWHDYKQEWMNKDRRY